MLCAAERWLSLCAFAGAAIASRLHQPKQGNDGRRAVLCAYRASNFLGGLGFLSAQVDANCWLTCCVFAGESTASRPHQQRRRAGERRPLCAQAPGSRGRQVPPAPLSAAHLRQVRRRPSQVRDSCMLSCLEHSQRMQRSAAACVPNSLRVWMGGWLRLSGCFSGIHNNRHKAGCGCTSQANLVLALHRNRPMCPCRITSR